MYKIYHVFKSSSWLLVDKLFVLKKYLWYNDSKKISSMPLIMNYLLKLTNLRFVWIDYKAALSYFVLMYSNIFPSKSLFSWAILIPDCFVSREYSFKIPTISIQIYRRFLNLFAVLSIAICPVFLFIET